MNPDRLVCTACGCSVALTAPTVAGFVRCPDCGKRLELSPGRSEKEEVAVESETSTSADTPRLPNLVPDHHETEAQAFPQPIARHRLARWPALLIGTIVGGAAVLTVVALHKRPTAPVVAAASSNSTPPVDPPAQVRHDAATPAETPLSRRLEELKRAADDMAVAGDLRGAYKAYNRVLGDFKDGGDSLDPATRKVLADARKAQAKVFDALIASEGSVNPRPVRSATSQPEMGTRDAVAPRDDRQFGGAQDRPPTAAGRQATAAPPSRPSQTPEEIRRFVDAAPVLPGNHPRPTLRTYLPPGQVTDEQIGRAIDQAITSLRTEPSMTTLLKSLARQRLATQQRPAGGAASATDPEIGPTPLLPNSPLLRDMAVEPGTSDADADQLVGETVLATYALLSAGRATDRPELGVTSPAVKAALEQIKAYPLIRTYTRSLRAAALAVYNRPEDRAALDMDVRWLIAANRDGGYCYVMPQASPSIAAPASRRANPGTAAPRSTFQYDNSNSQYGLLGVWSGAQSGLPIPANYWQAVSDHWVRCASPEGQWGYTAPTTETHLAMTLAGVASLLVSSEYLDAAAGPVNPPGPPAALVAGLIWLEQGDNCMFDPPGKILVGTPGYTHYGLERVGLATGFKFFGKHDWYGEVAGELVNTQGRDGSLGGPIDTSFNLLFLARGRHPILYQKLRYNGNWDNRRHDVANLSRFAGQKLERPLNWQVVDLTHPWSDWTDAPVLYISGDKPPVMTDADIGNIRDFALAGGLIFTHADGGSREFTKWVEQLVRKAFPTYELMKVPKDHPLYSSMVRLKNLPPLEAVNNGSRLLLIHSATDVASGWTTNWTGKDNPAFDLGTNIFVYAAGRTSYRYRMQSSYVPEWTGKPSVTLPVTRLRYSGSWDPEPYAWTRFSRAFEWDTHAALDVQTADLKDLKPAQTPAAFLTGTFRQDFTPAEAAAARAYVSAGGVLVIDACGGNAAFDQSVRSTLLATAFPESVPTPLPVNHPALIASRPFAQDVTAMRLRPYAAERAAATTGPAGPDVSTVEGFKCGAGWVLICRHDLTVGLLATQTWGIDGYDPAYAEAFVRNVILWSAARSGLAVPAQ